MEFLDYTSDFSLPGEDVRLFYTNHEMQEKIKNKVYRAKLARTVEKMVLHSRCYYKISEYLKESSDYRLYMSFKRLNLYILINDHLEDFIKPNIVSEFSIAQCVTEYIVRDIQLILENL